MGTASKTSTATSRALDPELRAMAAVHRALKPLTADAQQRVVEYVKSRLARESANGEQPTLPGA